MSILLIDKTENILQAAVINHNALYAYSSSLHSSSISEGQIYIGVVGRALKSVSAVFVKIDDRNLSYELYELIDKLSEVTGLINLEKALEDLRPKDDKDEWDY